MKKSIRNNRSNQRILDDVIVDIINFCCVSAEVFNNFEGAQPFSISFVKSNNSTAEQTNELICVPIRIRFSVFVELRHEPVQF